MSESLPVYQGLAEFMGLDPELPAPACHWEPWGLDDAYPPTLRELIDPLYGHNDRWWNEPHEESHEADATEQEAADAGGSGGTIPSGPQDSGPVGADGQDRGAENPGGA